MWPGGDGGVFSCGCTGFWGRVWLQTVMSLSGELESVQQVPLPVPLTGRPHRPGRTPSPLHPFLTRHRSLSKSHSERGKGQRPGRLSWVPIVVQGHLETG